jgi:polyketide biosynthesis enoyl-CoA hydratase PksI
MGVGDDMQMKSEIKDSVAVLSIGNSATNNALTDEFVTEIVRNFQEFEKNPNIHAVVIQNEGKFFCSGGTKDQLLGIAEGRGQFTDMANFDILARFPLPVVCSIGGHAFGGGFVFGLYADIPIVAEESLYSANFMKYGLTPGLGGTLVLPTRLGSILANEMMWTGEVYYGRELAQRSPQIRSAKREDVNEKALQMARTIAESPRRSLIELKQHLNRELYKELNSTVQTEAQMHRNVVDQTFVERINKLIRSK